MSACWIPSAPQFIQFNLERHHSSVGHCTRSDTQQKVERFLTPAVQMGHGAEELLQLRITRPLKPNILSQTECLTFYEEALLDLHHVKHCHGGRSPQNIVVAMEILTRLQRSPFLQTSLSVQRVVSELTCSVNVMNLNWLKQFLNFVVFFAFGSLTRNVLNN